MQESFQEKRRADALRSNPMRGLRAVAFLVLAGVLVGLAWFLGGPESKAPVQTDGTPMPLSSPSPGYGPTDPKADKVESLVFTSFSSSGKKGVELEARGVSGRETERRYLDVVKARIPFMSEGKASTLEIVADHAQHVASRPSALFQGHVTMTTEDGLVMETDELFYDGYDGRAQSERKVTFRRKDMSGEAMGMLYESFSDSITLFRNVRILLRDPDDPPADIEAMSGCLSRVDNALFLDGSVRVTQGANRTTSGSLQLFFGDDRAIQRAVFKDGFETVAQGDSGTLGLTFPRAGGRKTLRGRRLDMTFGEGRRVEEVAAGPEAEMVIEPGPADLPERREVKADTLVFKFTPEGKMREYIGTAGSRVRFVPIRAGKGDSRSVTSTDFFATLDPATGEAETLSFVENVVFERAGQRGLGAKAEFKEKTAKLTLSGGASFQDSINRVTLDAPTVDVDTRSGSFRAWGGVRHTQKGGLANSPFGSSGADLFATSRQVVYDAPAKKTQYLERAVFRAGTDEMRAQTIETVETPDGPEITADSELEILVRGGPAGDGLKASASHMTYTARARSFLFKGAAVVEQKDFETRAPEILVGLVDGKDFQVGRLEARAGAVSIKSGDRSADGSYLHYTPSDGKVAMTGTPVVLQHEGRRVQGKSVTFFTSGDQVEVVGEEGRTETVLQRKIRKP